MNDDAIRLRREPPLYTYRGYHVSVFRNQLGHYEAYVNGHRVRAPDVIPLEFIDYGSGCKCAEKVVDRHILRSRQLS